MRKHKIYLIIALVVGLMVSCSEDFLDQTPKGIVTAETYFQTPEQVFENLLISYRIASDQWHGSFWGFGDLCSDDAHKGGQSESDQQQMEDCAQFRATSTNAQLNRDSWTPGYQGIRNCNQVIENALQANYSDAALQKRHIGEAKFLRSYFYMYLSRIFGGIPILSSTVNMGDELIIPRSTKEEVYAMIKTSLEEAITDLPSVVDFDMSTEWGRVHKEAAQALLATAALYFHDYPTARDAAKAVIDAGYFELNPEFQDEFIRHDGPSKESIWEVIHANTNGQGNGTMDGVQLRPPSSNGWNFCGPTSSLANEFEAQDPRRIFTILEIGDQFPSLTGDIEVIGGTTAFNHEKMWGRKIFLLAKDRPASFRDNANNFRRLTYSDVLLQYAEALLETGGDPQVVCDYINMVRHRANTSRKYDIEAYGTTVAEKTASRVFQVAPGNLPDVTVADDLTAAIRHERRVELGMENFRFWDLKRWGYAYSAPLLISARGAFGPIEDNLNENRFNAFPIPQDEIDRTGGVITQNPQ